MMQLSSDTNRPTITPPSATTVVVVAIVIVVGLVALLFARRAIDPLDRLLTAHACSGPGDEVFRPVEEVEASNRFSLINRSQGWCRFGPVDQELAAEEGEIDGDDGDDGSERSPGAQILVAADPQAEVQLTIPEIEPGGLYRAGKWMGLLLQMGAASVAMRLVADPLFDRFLRRRRQ